MKTGSHRSNRRSIMLSFLASGVALSCLVSPLAYGRITIEPRIDAREVFSDNINASVDGFRDAGIISVIQPGVSVTVTSAKIEASLDYNIAFRQPLFAKTNGSQINHNLVARGAAKLIDDFLFLNAGAVVTQLFRNPQGSVTLNPDSLSSNLNHVGTFYIEPSIRRRLNQYVNLTINTQAGLTVLRDRKSTRLNSSHRH